MTGAQMMRAGVVLNMTGIALITLVSTTLAVWVFSLR